MQGNKLLSTLFARSKAPWVIRTKSSNGIPKRRPLLGGLFRRCGSFGGFVAWLRACTRLEAIGLGGFSILVKGESSAQTDTAHILGGRGPVPAGIHERMEELAARGSIPITTLPQRLRSMPTAGSRYHVPKELLQARDYGYIGPNLPPPLGLHWVASDGGFWALREKGG